MSTPPPASPVAEPSERPRFLAIEVGDWPGLEQPVRLELAPRTTVLVGQNGAGKSLLVEGWFLAVMQTLGYSTSPDAKFPTTGGAAKALRSDVCVAGIGIGGMSMLDVSVRCPYGKRSIKDNKVDLRLPLIKGIKKKIEDYGDAAKSWLLLQ